MMSEHPPPSILRRNGHRLSIPSATRQPIRRSLLFESNSNNLINNNTNSSSIPSSVAKRRSLTMTPASGSKRRQSSFLPSAQQTPSSSQQIPIPSAYSASQTQSQSQRHPQQQPQLSKLVVDPRPIRDSNYISLIQQEVFDFLTVNKFEVETNHSLTSKTLRSPTQKDFMLIFQFLYHKIDPFYQFAKNFDTDVLTSLKMLNYPYVDTLNRSSLSSVSPQNWPNILGMLYWLVKLNLRLSVVNIDSFLKGEENFTLSADDKLDRIFNNYTKQAYQKYLQNEDDYSSFYDEMMVKFDTFKAGLLEEVAELSKVTEMLSTEFSSLEKQLQLIETTENQSRALETDLVQLKAYNETLESATASRQEKLTLIEEELRRQEEDLQNIHKEKAQCEERLREKGLNISDIDKLVQERDGLSKEITKQQESIDMLNNDYQIKEIDIHKKYESLNNFINQYNNIIDKITRSRSRSITGEHSNNPSHSFSELKLTIGSNLLDNGSSFHDTAAILSGKQLGDEKVKLETYRGSIRQNINHIERQAIELQGELDVMETAREQLQKKVETLQDDFARLVRASDDIKAYGTNLQHTYAISIHKLHNEIKELKFNSNSKELLLERESELRDMEIKYNQIERDVLNERIDLQNKVYALIDDIIKFKVNVQEKLEEVSTLASEEYDTTKETDLFEN